MDYKELAEKLENLEVIAYGYNINGEVMGMDCSDFEQIMVDAMDAITDLFARAEAAEKERDWLKMCFDLAQRKEKEAVSDMGSLMWHSGDGCNICANAIEVHREPYVRLDCALKSQECNPKWRGQKEG